jgi:serine/threonine-protein kinase
MPLTSGTRIGSYELAGAIGAGGMGEVYRARDTKLGRDVALKVLPALVASDPERLARFRREAQMLAALNDPHIAQIYGFEDSGNTHALVMELVDGPTLAERIAAGPVPIPDALSIARQIATALDAAHERGIVHRDLKPANVKVRDDGTVKVLDFGLAKALGPEGPNATADVANSPTMTAHATEMGMILGTAAYMAPEQAKGRPVDKRADIWAFGVVLFEMLTGRRLFEGEDASEILAAVLRQEIDWSRLPDRTPPAIRHLLRRCLERDRKARLRDIGDALSDLDAPADPTASPVTHSRLSRALPWIIATLAVLAVAGVLAWARSRPSAPPAGVIRANVLIQGYAGFVAVSHDGRQIAYSSLGANGASLVRRRMDELASQPIAGSETGITPLFSPDSQWIAYTTLTQPQRIKKIPVAGGTPITICDGSLFAGGTWTDDDHLIFGGNRGLMRVPASGGAPESLTTVDKDKGEIFHLWPQVLPGERQLLFTVVTGGGAEFAVLDLANHQYRTIAKGGIGGRYVGNGYLTYVRDSTLYAVPFDARRLAVAGDEIPVVQGVTMPERSAIADYGVSDTGLLVYVAAEAGQNGTTLAWVDRHGDARVMPGASHQSWGRGRLSPDGHRVANTLIRDGRTDVWVMDTERGALTRLTFDGDNQDPIWTPDGRTIVYWSRRTAPDKSGIYRVAADGSGSAALVFATETPSTPTSLSPSADRLLLQQTNDRGQSQIFTLPLARDGSSAGEPRPLHDAHADEADGEISPDGQWVAYQSSESGDESIYVQPFPGPGATTRISADLGSAPRWARDGRSLYYWSGAAVAASSALVHVAIPPGMPLRPGAPETLFQMPHGSTWDVSLERDRFLVELPGTGLPKDAVSTFVFVTNWFDELRRHNRGGRP